MSKYKDENLIKSAYGLKTMGFDPDQASRTAAMWKACEGITTEELRDIAAIDDPRERLIRLAGCARELADRVEYGIRT